MTVRRKPTTPALVIDRANVGMLADGIESGGVSAIYNRYIAVNGSDAAISVLGEPSRYVDFYDEAPTMLAGESLQAYADRMLAEVNAHGEPTAYTRDYAPGIVPFDVVHVTVAGTGLAAMMRIVTQSMPFGGRLQLNESTEVIAA